jgi:IclR family pca regulon transcriptional regulator
MIARALPRHTLPVGQGLGFQVPAVRSALGLVLLSGIDEERRRQHLLDHAGRDDQSLRALEDTIAEVASKGYAYVAHEVEAGFHSIAVPLLRWDGKPIAALNVGNTVERLPEQAMREQILPVLKETADKLRPQLV